MAKRKVQKLDDSDKEYIEKYHNTKTPDQISHMIGRPVELIFQYINNIMSPAEPDAPEDTPICPELYDLPQWKFYERSFSKEELALFEATYLSMKDQFKDDILVTERTQVFQAIELEIFMHQNKIARRKLHEDIERMRKFIAEESKLEKENQNLQAIQEWQDRIASCYSGINACESKFNDSLAQHQKILDKLKATREQRIKIIDSSKVTFAGLVKMIHDQEFRDREAKQAALMKKAIAKEKARLGSFHTYLDGAVDIPFLTPETILEKEQFKNSKDNDANQDPPPEIHGP
jgi:hypothetical protein